MKTKLHHSKKIFFIINLWLLLFQPLPATEAALSSLHYVVAQQTFRTNGVLVSRPDPTDERILDTIYLYQIHSVEDLSQWLEKNIRYQNDTSGPQWTEPLEMLKKKYGDCEDYALLTAAFLRVLGYQPHFLALVRPDQSHAICTFQSNGVYFWFDNAKLIKTNATSLQQLAQNIAFQYHYAKLLEMNTQDKTWKLVYKES